MQERLDRCLASPSWKSLFPCSYVYNFVFACSDHNGVEAFLLGKSEFRMPKWQFEAMWTMEGKCEDIFIST